jgi:hypothetical protein
MSPSMASSVISASDRSTTATASASIDMIKRRRIRIGTRSDCAVTKATKSEINIAIDDDEEEEETKKKKKLCYIDGANVCWAYCAALRASNNALARIPVSTALEVVLEYFEDEYECVIFAPKHYARGKLNGLCDGGNLKLLNPKKVVYVGNNEWENVYLMDLFAMNKLRLIDRQTDSRGRAADDLAILDEAFDKSLAEKHNTVVVISNDKYEGHVPNNALADKKSFRDWLKRTRKSYEFDVGKFDIPNFIENWPKVGALNGNLQPPDGFDEWCEEKHASGSSRPWSKEVIWIDRKFVSKKKKKTRGGLGGTRMVITPTPPTTRTKNDINGVSFAFWNLDLGILDVNFSVK